MTSIQLADMSTLQRVFCVAAGETEVPPLNLSKKMVVRTPHFWILMVEEREATRGQFVTEDGTDGPLTLRFMEAVTRCYASTIDPPFILSEEDRRSAADLTVVFRALGALYSAVPLQTPATSPAGELPEAKALRLAKAKKDAAVNLATILEPLLLQARRHVETLNSSAIRRFGGSSERYLAAQLLLPSDWPSRDREALKKATTRSETFLPDVSVGGRGDRKRNRGGKSVRVPNQAAPPGHDICTICQKPFLLGKWNEHKKKDCS